MVNDVAFALSPTSRFNPIVKAAWDGKQYDIIEDKTEVSRLKTGLQEDAAFLYLNILISQLLKDIPELKNYGMSPKGLQDKLKDELNSRLEELKKSIAKDLPHINFARFHYEETMIEGNTVCLPYTRKDDGQSQILRYYLADDKVKESQEKTASVPILGFADKMDRVRIPSGVDGLEIILEDPLKETDTAEENRIEDPVAELANILDGYRHYDAQNILSTKGHDVLVMLRRAEKGNSVPAADKIGFDINELKGRTYTDAIEWLVARQMEGMMPGLFITPEEYRALYGEFFKGIDGPYMYINDGCKNDCPFCLKDVPKYIFSRPFPILTQLIIKKSMPFSSVSLCFLAHYYYENNDPLYYYDRVSGADLSHIIMLDNKYKYSSDYSIARSISTAGYSPFVEEAQYIKRMLRRLKEADIDWREFKLIVVFHFFRPELIDAIIRRNREDINKTINAYKRMYKELMLSLNSEVPFELKVRHLKEDASFTYEHSVLPRTLEIVEKINRLAFKELTDDPQLAMVNKQVHSNEGISWGFAKPDRIIAELVEKEKDTELQAFLKQYSVELDQGKLEDNPESATPESPAEPTPAAPADKSKSPTIERPAQDLRVTAKAQPAPPASTAVPDLDRERNVAVDFRDAIIDKAEKAKKEGRFVILGLEQTWIKNKSGPQAIILELERLPENLRQRGLDNVIFKRGEGDALATTIAKEREGRESQIPLSNIVVLGSQSILQSEAYNVLRSAAIQESAFLIGIDNSHLDYKSGTRLLEMYLLGLKLNSVKLPDKSDPKYKEKVKEAYEALIKALDTEFIKVGFYFNGKFWDFIFTPIEPYDVNQFRKINDIQIREIDSKA